LVAMVRGSRWYCNYTQNVCGRCCSRWARQQHESPLNVSCKGACGLCHRRLVPRLGLAPPQEVTERLHWLGYYGLGGPYVSLAAVSGEWSKAIKMLLRRGAK
jgi:hypothetical protein